jgi:outer membrane protein OmpA-like peptidoglycan-associated protein
MESPDAFLSQDLLRIRAAVGSKTIAEEQVQEFRRHLPPSTNLDTQFILINEDATVNHYCERQYAAHTTGPIAFEESGTRMRTSAYPVLDRVIALADACRDSMIVITGHTDSTGSEVQNQQLSLARARTVAAYLGAKGIAAERLVTIGAGSSLPIADNATRYGRSINRRIDIHFEETG